MFLMICTRENKLEQLCSIIRAYVSNESMSGLADEVGNLFITDVFYMLSAGW